MSNRRLWRFVVIAFLGISAAPGCVAVRSWERGRLASAAMTDPLLDHRMVTQYRAKVLESRTGGGLPGTASGGGCGCTQ